MGNYGFRISQDGQDVKTCSDLQTVVTSKYANLKGSLSGSVSLTKTGDNQQKTVVAHNLGYIPIIQVLASGGDYGSTFVQLPVLYSISVYADSTNVYIKFISGVSNGTYSFKYYIFLDKGKL